jgi:hypothetical protein
MLPRPRRGRDSIRRPASARRRPEQRRTKDEQRCLCSDLGLETQTLAKKFCKNELALILIQSKRCEELDRFKPLAPLLKSH